MFSPCRYSTEAEGTNTLWCYSNRLKLIMFIDLFIQIHYNKYKTPNPSTTDTHLSTTKHSNACCFKNIINTA